MALCKLFVCSNCKREIQSWSDGNPYFLNANEEKEYAYHPDHVKLSKCIGNDTPQICLSCTTEFMSDSESPTIHCPQCQSKEIADMFQLENRICPYCNEGQFALDQNGTIVS